MLPDNLTSLVPFRGLHQEDAVVVCSALETTEFSVDETIFSEGDDTQALWIILSGECIVSRSGGNNDRILAVLTAGDVFGEMSFLRHSPHSASIIAVQPVKACCYRREHFVRLAEKRPAAALIIAENIASVLAERLRRMDTWVCDMMESPEGEDYRDEWKSFRSAVYTNWDF